MERAVLHPFAMAGAWRRLAVLGVVALAACASAPRPDPVSAPPPGASAASANSAASVRTYVLLNAQGTRGGEQLVVEDTDGWVTVDYLYKDNGRGPEIRERLRIGPDGSVLDYHATGKNSMGAEVDERFSRAGSGVAQWRSRSEQGEAQVPGPASYLELDGSFELTSRRIAAAVRHGGRLPLLPSGTFELEVVDRATVEDGGQSQPLQLVAARGIGLTPNYYWATEGGSPRLFAAIYPGWFAAIESGWESKVAELSDRQRQAEGKQLSRMRSDLAQPLPKRTWVRNARLFDSGRARLAGAREWHDLLIENGRIKRIVRAGSAMPAARAGRADGSIDARGRVVLPGLFDMHVHVDRWDGGLHLAAGVTTVRDMGSAPDTMAKLLAEQAADRVLLPHVIPTGFIEGKSNFSSTLGILVENLDEARRAVDWYADRGYKQIKIYNSFPVAALPETIAHAHRRGLKVSGHVPYGLRAEEAVRMGYDEIQHINQVLLNFLVTPTTETRTPLRFTLPAEKLATHDFDSTAYRDFVALLKARGTVVDPTVVTFDFIRRRGGTLSEPFAAVADHLPTNSQRRLRRAGLPIPDDATEQRYRASYAKMVEFIGRMERAGIPIVPGTDGFAGFGLHAELAAYVDAGLSSARVLQIATRDSARVAGVGRDRGVIAVGRRADLVIVDGNPVERIGDLSRMWRVVTQQHVIRPAAIHRALGVRPFVDGAASAQAAMAERAERAERGSPLARIRSATGLHAGH